MPFGSGTIGAGVMACADTAIDRAKPAIAINLIILNLPRPSNHPDLLQREKWSGSHVKIRALQACGPVARTLEIDQGLYDDRVGTSVAELRFEVLAVAEWEWECRPFGFYPWRKVDQFSIATANCCDDGPIQGRRMGGYIDEILQPGERVLYPTNEHWMFFLPAIAAWIVTVVFLVLWRMVAGVRLPGPGGDRWACRLVCQQEGVVTPAASSRHAPIRVFRRSFSKRLSGAPTGHDNPGAP
jgi:hypothetical protein